MRTIIFIVAVLSILTGPAPQGFAATDDSRQWYIYQQKERFGPYRESEIRKWIADGKLKKNTVVWKPGMEGWTRIRNVPELRDLLGKNRSVRTKGSTPVNQVLKKDRGDTMEGSERKHGEVSNQQEKSETRSPDLVLPSGFEGIRMGMTGEEIKAIRKQAQNYQNRFVETPTPAEKKKISEFFGFSVNPSDISITFYLDGEKKLNSVYFSITCGSESDQVRALDELKKNLVKYLGDQPGLTRSTGGWNKPGLFYSYSSGTSGTTSKSYWIAYQIDKSTTSGY